MKDISFIRIDPKTRKVTFGIFPDVLEGPAKLVQEVYLALIGRLNVFLFNFSGAAEAHVLKVINDVENAIRSSQLSSEQQLPLNERLASIEVTNINFVNNELNIELAIIAESRQRTILNLSQGE